MPDKLRNWYLEGERLISLRYFPDDYVFGNHIYNFHMDNYNQTHIKENCNNIAANFMSVFVPWCQ